MIGGGRHFMGLHLFMHLKPGIVGILKFNLSTFQRKGHGSKLPRNELRAIPRRQSRRVTAARLGRKGNEGIKVGQWCGDLAEVTWTLHEFGGGDNIAWSLGQAMLQCKPAGRDICRYVPPYSAALAHTDSGKGKKKAFCFGPKTLVSLVKSNQWFQFMGKSLRKSANERCAEPKKMQENMRSWTTKKLRVKNCWKKEIGLCGENIFWYWENWRTRWEMQEKWRWILCSTEVIQPVSRLEQIKVGPTSDQLRWSWNCDACRFQGRNAWGWLWSFEQLPFHATSSCPSIILTINKEVGSLGEGVGMEYAGWLRLKTW